MSLALREEACGAAWKIFQPTSFSGCLCSFESQIAIVDRLEQAAFVFFNIAAVDDPITPQLSQTLAHVRSQRRISIRAAGVIDAHRRILFQLVLEVASWILIDFAKGHAHAWLFAVDVDAT